MHNNSDSTGALSKSQVLQARLATILLVVLIVLGAVLYGISFASFDRFWSEILERPGGPMTFRFILQPVMAALVAFRDGAKDARLGRVPYLLSILRGTKSRSNLIWEGIVATARILILGIVMDAIYQWLVFKTFYPAEAAMIAILLAFIPYLLLRGPMARLAKRWVARSATK
jgi:phosphate/sulfate permease